MNRLTYVLMTAAGVFLGNFLWGLADYNDDGLIGSGVATGEEECDL